MYLLEHQTADTYLQKDDSFDENWMTAIQMNLETAELKKIELQNQGIPTWLRSTDDMVLA